jgi:hypothetical protein
VYYYDGLGNTTWDRPAELKGEDGEEEDAAADEEVGMAFILTSKGKMGCPRYCFEKRYPRGSGCIWVMMAHA